MTGWVEKFDRPWWPADQPAPVFGPEAFLTPAGLAEARKADRVDGVLLEARFIDVWSAIVASEHCVEILRALAERGEAGPDDPA